MLNKQIYILQGNSILKWYHLIVFKWYHLIVFIDTIWLDLQNDVIILFSTKVTVLVGKVFPQYNPVQVILFYVYFKS